MPETEVVSWVKIPVAQGNLGGGRRGRIGDKLCPFLFPWAQHHPEPGGGVRGGDGGRGRLGLSAPEGR